MPVNRAPLDSPYNVRLNRMIRSRFPNQKSFTKAAHITQAFLTNVLFYRTKPSENHINHWSELLQVPKEKLQEIWTE